MPYTTARGLKRLGRGLPLCVIFLAAALLMLVLLVACGPVETLSDVRTSSTTITPNADGRDDIVMIEYRIGQRARVKAYVEDGKGTRYVLRDDVLRVPT